MNQPLTMLQGIQPDELVYLENVTNGMNNDQLNTFISLYGSRRKTTETVLICTILGFVVIAGIQRFILGQIGMGILYLFTGGLCLIGTIVDLVNHKQMTFEYNQQQAVEVLSMIRR
ncbi:MAG: TM2 domain-containing protein [Chitinophagaceae bacterium]|nr:TM2 domain-containing protein [Chitinophagaceae bacterium]